MKTLDHFCRYGNLCDFVQIFRTIVVICPLLMKQIIKMKYYSILSQVKGNGCTRVAEAESFNTEFLG